MGMRKMYLSIYLSVFLSVCLSIISTPFFSMQRNIKQNPVNWALIPISIHLPLSHPNQVTRSNPEFKCPNPIHSSNPVISAPCPQKRRRKTPRCKRQHYYPNCYSLLFPPLPFPFLAIPIYRPFLSHPHLTIPIPISIPILTFSPFHLFAHNPIIHPSRIMHIIQRAIILHSSTYLSIHPSRAKKKGMFHFRPPHLTLHPRNFVSFCGDVTTRVVRVSQVQLCTTHRTHKHKYKHIQAQAQTHTINQDQKS